MAQEIVTWCDVHLNQDVNVKGQQLVLSVNGAAAVTVDLCENCEKELMSPVLDTINAMGRKYKPGSDPAPRRRKSPAQRAAVEGAELYDCPVPGCGERRDRRDRMRDHVEKEHDMLLARAEGDAGKTFDGRAIEHMCPVKGCGCGYTRAQGLALHTKHAHSGTKAA